MKSSFLSASAIVALVSVLAAAPAGAREASGKGAAVAAGAGQKASQAGASPSARAALKSRDSLAMRESKDWLSTLESKDSLAQLAAQVDIPYEQFTLPNGLRVLVHTDRKAPVVALSVWYDVGSKHEPTGKTGFAHLFEHLMFNGSENADDDYFVPLKEIGATSYNGTTWYDRTNYYETVPTGALEKALWLESDRMGYLLGAITQEKLDNQRGVVQNEKRQGDNKPFGLVQYFQTRALYPADHPYGHSTIGSMADLDAASLADVHGWFKSHYGPNNAILALAGDIDVPTAKRLVTQYFGGMKAGPKTHPVDVPVPTLTARKDETIHDRVSQTQISRMWAVPGVNDPDTIPLEIGLSVLGGLASSRLDNILVKEEKLATRVSAGVQSFAQGGQVEVSVDVRDGVDPAMVDKRLDAILADYLANGPSAAEVNRAATQEITQYVKGLEAVGTKAQVLAEALLFSSDAGRYKKDLAAYAGATPARVTAALQKWLGRPVYALTVAPGARTPFPEEAPKAAAKAPATPVAVERIARDPAPAVAPPETLAFPNVEHARLSNGIELVYAQRRTVPMTLVSLSVDAGSAADPVQKRGISALTSALLGEGTTRLSGTQIAEKKEELGAAIGSGAGRDRSGVSLSALSTNLAPSLDLFADIILHPAFAAADVERVRGQMLASIAADKTSAGAMAADKLAPALYGAEHPYGAGSGKGTTDSVKGLTAADLSGFHQSWFRPEKAKIFIVSDKPLAEVQPLLEARFGGWKASGTAGTKKLAMTTQQVGPRILLVDRKDSPQSQISAGQLLAIDGTTEHLALSSAADVVGGGFLSRINMDLRETKGWSYGVRAGLSEREGQLSYQISAPVQADQTGPAIAALMADYQAFLGPKGVTAEELARTQDGDIRELPGAFQTAKAVMNALQENDLFGRPDDYYAKLPAEIRAQTATSLDAAARGAIDPARFTWVVVGDAAIVKPQLDTLGLPVEVVTSQ